MKNPATRKNSLLILMGMRWRIIKNMFSRPTKEKKFRWTMLFVLGAVFIWLDYMFFYRIIGYLDGLPLQIGEELIAQLINVIFLTLLVMVLFSTLIVSLSVFYMGRDLECLHAMPINIRTVIPMRVFQTVLNSSWMVLLFSIPIFVAYGYYFKISLGYYFFLLPSLILFIIIPCLLGIMMVMAMMRYFPTKKTHQIFSFMGMFAMVGFVVYLRFLSPEKFFGKEVSDEMMIAFVESLKAPDYFFLPSSWMMTALLSWAGGDTALAWQQMLYLGLSVLVLFGLLLWVSGKIYYESWRQVQEVRFAPLEKKGFGNSSDSVFWRRLPLSSSTRALLAKDFRVFTRDPEQWSQVLVLVALVFVYIFNIMNLPLDNLILKNIVSVFNVGLVGFVLSALILRFVFSAPSIEGRKIWTLYTAPLNMRNFLFGKICMFLPPLLLVAEFLVIVSNNILEVDSYVMTVSITGVLLITVGLVGLGLGLGAKYPVFDYENISDIATGTGGVLFMILSLGFVGLVLVIGARPMYLHFNQKFLLKGIVEVDVMICYGLIFIMTFLVTFIPLKQGLRSLRQMDV
jgi:ABC-2 type transport system permease protein